jgi:hypothetical protein
MSTIASLTKLVDRAPYLGYSLEGPSNEVRGLFRRFPFEMGTWLFPVRKKHVSEG